MNSHDELSEKVTVTVACPLPDEILPRLETHPSRPKSEWFESFTPTFTCIVRWDKEIDRFEIRVVPHLIG